jgi:hypothetical protein
MAMINATIWLDGKAYQGEDPDEGEQTPGPHNISFHEYNTTRDKLAWGDAPRVLEGSRNITSHAQKILARISDGSLAAGELTICFGEVK